MTIYFNNYEFHHKRLASSEPEKEIRIASQDGGAYSVSVCKSPGGRTSNYTIYPPSESNRSWKIVPFMDRSNPRIFQDPQARYSILPFQQASRRNDLMSGVSILTTIASVVLLACKLLGKIRVGHWGLYLAAGVISAVAFTKLAYRAYEIQFQIANRIYSVLELSPKNNTEIDLD